MLLDGREVAGFIKERHRRQMGAYQPAPKLAIVLGTSRADTARFVRAKQSYGTDIGAFVEVMHPGRSITGTIEQLNRRPDVTGILVQLPLDNLEDTEAALTAIDPAKDVDGLGPDSPFDVPAVKGILWLLAAYSIEVKPGPVAVIGQGRLVGRPLSDQLESSGVKVVRCDETTPDLAAAIAGCKIVVSATGHSGLLTEAQLVPGVTVVDAGGGEAGGDADPKQYLRGDIKISPVPGGVGPMTVAALFDNLLLAAQSRVRN